MKYAIEIGSGAIVYVPRFIKNVSGIQKMMGGYTDTQEDTDCISLFLFFLNKEGRLKGGSCFCLKHRDHKLSRLHDIVF
jgi:hypothetical protein